MRHALDGHLQYQRPTSYRNSLLDSDSKKVVLPGSEPRQTYLDLIFADAKMQVKYCGPRGLDDLDEFIVIYLVERTFISWQSERIGWRTLFINAEGLSASGDGGNGRLSLEGLKTKG